MNIIIILFGLLVVSSVIIFVYKMTALKIKYNFILTEKIELLTQNKFLNDQNIIHIQKIEQLNAKIDYLNMIISESERMKKESFELNRSILSDFSAKIFEMHKKENKEITELSKKNVETSAEKFNKEFERLINIIGSLTRDVEKSKSSVDIITQSLLSPSGSGQLAEITLGNLLKSSGLRQNHDFWIQASFALEDSNKIRPDAYIKLPGGHLMIIDAKASKFLMDDCDQAGLAKTMNLHLKSLNVKEYAQNIVTDLQKKGEDINHVTTIMFLPTDHAIEKVQAADDKFIQKAQEKAILLAGPAGLMNILSFAKFQIMDQMRLENHKIIIEEIKKLLASVALLSEHSQKLGTNIQNMVSNYDKFAATFNRNFLSRAKNISKLGIEIQNNQKEIKNLERYQLVSSKSELIEAEAVNPTSRLEEF